MTESRRKKLEKIFYALAGAELDIKTFFEVELAEAREKNRQCWVQYLEEYRDRILKNLKEVRESI